MFLKLFIILSHIKPTTTTQKSQEKLKHERFNDRNNDIPLIQAQLLLNIITIRISGREKGEM